MDANVNPAIENQIFNVPKLQLLSLKKATDLVVAESQLTVQGKNVKNDLELKSKSEYIWFIFKQILEREEEFGCKAIRLIRILSYFGGNQTIQYGIVDLEYTGGHNYDYPNKEIFKVLKLLDTYGLIQMEVTEGQNFRVRGITLPSDSWMSVIRERNEKNSKLEKRLLRRSFKIVRMGGNDSVKFSVSQHLLENKKLAKQFKKFFIETYWNEQHGADILEKFEEVFGRFDPATIQLRYRHLISVLESEEAENEIKLAKCEAVRAMFDGDRDYYNGKVWIIPELIYDIGNRNLDNEYRDIFYEESLHWYKMIHKHLYQKGLRDGSLDYRALESNIKKIVNILNELNRSEEIYDLFRELRMEIISKGKEQIINEESPHFGFDYFLSTMIELILKIENPTLKKCLTGEMLMNSKFGFKIVLNAQKENFKCRNRNLCINFPNIVKNLIKCLIKFDQFDRILNVIQETDLVWQEFIQILLYDKDLENVPHIFSYIDDYFVVHNLIFRICIKNQTVKDNVELKEMFLNQSVSALMPLCLSVSSLSLLEYPYEWLTFLGKCLIQLNQMNELIIFMNNLERLLDRHIVLDFFLTIVKYLTPLNGRIEYLSVLYTALEITKRFLNVIGSNSLNYKSMKTGLRIIKLCESLLKN